MNQWRVLIVDDHPLFRDALKLALGGVAANMLISEAGNLDQVNGFLTDEHEFDLVMLDLRMPGVQGFSGLVYLRSEFPSVPVVIVSGQDEPAIMRRALALGAAGYIPKSTGAEEIRQAVAAILAGGIWAPNAAKAAASDPETEDLAQRLASLTPQQLRVLMMLREGKLNKQIAFLLTVSEATVKAHVSAILQKLNVDSRTQAVIVASRIDGDLPE